MMAPQKKILIVEDNGINRAVLRGILEPRYEILEAENGQQALSVLAEQGEEISLILLDIIMPVMDGYTFLARMKETPAFSSIPVIVTTQSDGETDEVAALSHGATDFVAKPYRPQVILHRVAGIINLRETAAMINQFKYDRLTGLYSKEFFYQKMREVLAQHPDRAYDIICSDVENFKLVNDIFGMPEGDRLLRGIAGLYERLVGTRGICGRFNADQFACLLERRETYTDEMFIRAAEEINTMTSAKSVVLKWGIYQVEDRTVPVEQMCDRALLAARNIKGQYGKYFACYDDDLREKLLRRQAITDSMEAALAEEQFEVYLQPKYSLRENLLAGAEALVRWNHPRWGFQLPSEFIPLFEQNGFITKLDQYVWDRACRLLREWDDKGYPPLPVSVNVSRADVYQADLPDILLRTVKKYRLPPSRLHLEITESAYTENPDQIIDTVRGLRRLGFVIEMDDFGSGYSSLNMLNRMPLDVLKLDMKFIRSETAKPADQGILRFIMGLARWMNLSVVAEGVETGEQLARLRELGCDYVQGYYFARPMPAGEFEALVRGGKRAAVKSGWDTASRRQARVLLVADGDPGYRAQVERTFAGRFQVEGAADREAALAVLTRFRRELSAVLLSLTLPGGGISVLEELRRGGAGSAAVVATGPADAGLEERALELGADDFAPKPHTQRSLEKRVLRALGAALPRRWERVLQDEACRDSLTGLLNVRGLEAAAGPQGPVDAPFAACLFDLDEMRAFNDTHGHILGDRLLQRFSKLLTAHTRATDLLSRVSGDEFAAVMWRLESPQAALRKGEEICRAFQACGEAGELPGACSAGIALCTGELSLEEGFRRAAEALKSAKSENRGGCRLWEDGR